MADKAKGLLSLLQQNGNGLLDEVRTAPQQVGEMFTPDYQKKLAMALKNSPPVDKEKWMHTGIELTGMAPFWWYINRFPPLNK